MEIAMLPVKIMYFYYWLKELPFIMEKNIQTPRLLSLSLPVFIGVFLISGLFRVSAQETQAASGGRLDPVFPETNSNIVFVEGEDAVSTNFTTEPVLLYGASRSRTLQLSRSTGLQGGGVFFAEWVFYLESDGVYDFWYGGTPPGPKDDLAPSYTSPVSLIIDDGPAVEVYREDVKVTGQYLPSYYWCRAGTTELTAGTHKLRLEVTQKRSYDGRYFFYLDNFFLVNKASESDPGQPLPRVFPEALTADTDITFLSLSDYEKKIQVNPGDVSGYIELASIYALVSDYVNAQKILRKAQLLFSGVRDLEVYAAKNRIWMGEIAEGLQQYRQVLAAFPDLLGNWAEAGKIAAWSAMYADAERFYLGGLAQFPGNLNLTVNLGLTYLWMADTQKAEQTFDKAGKIAGDDPALIKELADVFVINGYPDRAVTIYRDSIKKHPEDLGLYFLLRDLLSKTGKNSEAEAVTQSISEGGAAGKHYSQVSRTAGLGT